MITPLTATATLERARTALQNGKGAGLPELLKIIETISTNLAEVTIQELAELIEKDAAVLARIVQIANTIVHNPSFTPLSSLTHAIHQIGFSRVRSLTLSIMLIENAGSRNPPEQREAAAQALCAGLLAQGCAQKFGYVDPEAAFACAALRNFGYILLPAVSLEHYREALNRRKDKPEDIAFRGMFGMTPLELSRRLLASARLPEEFMRAMRDTTPEAMAGTATLPETRLMAMAEFGSRIAQLSLDASKGSDSFGEGTRELARRFRRVIPDALDYIPEALEHTDARLSGFLRADGIAALPTASLNRIRARVQHVAPDSVVITAAAPEAGPDVFVPATDAAAINTTMAQALGAAAVAPIAASEPVTAEVSPKMAEADAASEVVPEATSAGEELPTAAEETPAPPESVASAESKPASAPPFETAALPEPPAPVARDPWLSALALVRDSFAADECWTFALKPGGVSMPLTHGVGERWQRFQAIAAVRSDERTVFGVCLSRKEAVVIHDLHDAKLKPYLPAWIREARDAPPSFVLVPLQEGARVCGVVLIGWHKTQRVTLNKAQLELARQILGNANALRPSAAA
ncbi:MAG: HDOD domain-containing protein [Opitutae bacterium]|nr:HDOD domain-containing protein [Opitutae bacterium]